MDLNGATSAVVVSDVGVEVHWVGLAFDDEVVSTVISDD